MEQYPADPQREQERRQEGRPDPEVLLRRYGFQDRGCEGVAAPLFQMQQERPLPAGDSPHRRGRLRVYLAAAAGAGKTYAMLNEGQRRVSRGTDVVAGYVEAHGRAQTLAQLGDLEVVPRRQVSYRGVTLEEMDTEAIVARRPQVVLIDELAHTNVPGSRHAKRFHDVLQVLEAGIDVVTTLNIQHLESLNDLVASITGVRVRETLPDWILDQAEEVELVDISPHALRQRMRHGNIYPPERIEAALHHFFREGNLIALREMALKRTAEKTEAQLQQYMTGHGVTRPWPASERVLVGFDHRPHTRKVIRDAWRLAHGLHADLLAVSIEPEGYRAMTGRLMRLLRYGSQARYQREAARLRMEEHARFAEDLGAEVIRAQGRDIAHTLVEIARKRQVTQIVIGQPARSRFEELLRGSITNRLLRLSTEIDIHLVPRGEQ
ncbi:MAG TPA: universal stress protein [Ktedonobacteraceae bacterium]|jgi:two-component system sensor histidine kinase KdpD